MVVAFALLCGRRRIPLEFRIFASAAHRGHYIAIIGGDGQFRVEVRCRSGNLSRRYRGMRSGAGLSVNVILLTPGVADGVQRRLTDPCGLLRRRAVTFVGATGGNASDVARASLASALSPPAAGLAL
jgi:hypothetical protein